ncbi:transposase [Saccharopolyspora sp. 5N102]|uniref:transposase n=1 Tax=Saccharopolyspora sp. 5N102 TaxID=3375155 RepID=UPI003788C8A0
MELFPGRDTRTLAGWLAAHPGVEVVCRDCSGSYAEGASPRRPGAMQVADESHLWQNLGKAAERCGPAPALAARRRAAASRTKSAGFRPRAPARGACREVRPARRERARSARN